MSRTPNKITEQSTYTCIDPPPHITLKLKKTKAAKSTIRCMKTVLHVAGIRYQKKHGSTHRLKELP